MMRTFLTALTVCLLLSACATDTVNHAGIGNAGAAGAETRLRNGDQVTIRLDTGGNQPPQSLDVLIDGNGEISLPLIGRIKAGGSTPGDLGERIQASYVPRYYVHCNAAVLATVRFFYVGGEVRAPSRYNWTEDVTLLKAINTAGGFTDFANRRKVEVARDKGKQAFDCDELRQHPDKDVPIQPGDSIYIPRSLF
jgi:polysaccharide export outer membrane protein